MYSAISSILATSSRGPRTVMSRLGTSTQRCTAVGRGYSPHDGFKLEGDENDFENYPFSAMIGASGHERPIEYRCNKAKSIHLERDPIHGYDKPRAQMEDTSIPVWCSGGMDSPMQWGLISANGQPRPYTAWMNLNMRLELWSQHHTTGSSTTA